METLLQDLRYGIRMLLRSPGFTLVAVLSLALGIGANTAIFSLVDKVLLRTLPVEAPDKLFILGVSTQRGVGDSFTYPDYRDYSDRNEVLEGLVCYSQTPLSLSEGGTTERLNGLMVSGNYFKALRVQPALGRGFLPEEDQTPNSHPVVVISHGLWQRRFGADPTLVGKTIKLNSHSFTVVGVAPPEFTGTVQGYAPDVYVPMMMVSLAQPSWSDSPLNSTFARNMYWLSVLARLKEGVSKEQAEASLTTLAGQIARANPNPDGRPRREPTLVLQPGSQGHTSNLRDLKFPLKMLLAIVGLVLLIACANVANLLLARASKRHKEIAVRLALGASRWRLMRQLLTESVLLAVLGGASGLLLASLLSELLLSFTPPNSSSTRAIDSSLDLRILSFTLLLSILTGLIFGLAPALKASKPDLVPALKDETLSLGKGVRRFSLKNMLVVAQVALSLMVLVGAGLCVRSLQNLQAIDAGFDPSKVLVMSVDVGLNGYEQERGRQFYEQLLARVSTVPGVEAASLGALVPLGSGAMSWTTRVEGYEPQPGENMNFDLNVIGPDYFRAMKIPLVLGREFLLQDNANSNKVVIVNETVARRFFPDQNPIGRRLIHQRRGQPGQPPVPDYKEIIGVVKDSKYRSLTETVNPTMYLPLAQSYRSDMTLHVRTVSEPTAMLATVRREVQALDATLPVYNIRTLTEQKSSSLYTSRMAATLLTVFGLLALLLAAIGLYGVMAYSVNRRTREIGIRLALGAGHGDVLRQVLGEGMVLVLIGLVVGVGSALAAARLVASFLYGVSATDPLTFAAVGVVLSLVALLANYIPARRAARVDPMVALRYE